MNLKDQGFGSGVWEDYVLSCLVQKPVIPLGIGLTEASQSAFSQGTAHYLRQMQRIHQLSPHGIGELFFSWMELFTDSASFLPKGVVFSANMNSDDFRKIMQSAPDWSVHAELYLQQAGTPRCESRIQ